jgi:sirohydrochlorin ferrochelatase
VGVHSKEVGGAEEIDDGLDAAGLFGIAEITFEIGDTAGGGEHGGEVAAGGGAPGGDARGIELVLSGLGADPPDGSLAVVDLGWELGDLAEAVVEGDDGVAVIEEPVDDGGLEGVLAAGAKCPAVDPEDDGKRAGLGGWAVNIDEKISGAGAGIDEVAVDASTRGSSWRLSEGGGKEDEGQAGGARDRHVF